MDADLDAELNPYYCTHCRCRISRKESNANNGLCEACAATARSRAQEEQARQERPPATTPFAPGAAEVPPGGDAPFDAWLITVGCQKVGVFCLLCLFVPFLSWFAGVAYLALGWLSMPHCQTEAGRRAADRIVLSGARMCGFAILAGIGITILIGITIFSSSTFY